MTAERIESKHAAAATSTCLVLMLKAPARAKRRIAEEIGELATELAERLTECALEDAANWPGPVRFAAGAAADQSWLERRIAAAPATLVQAGGNLGERLNDIDRRLRAQGQRRLLYIGSDCPGIDGDYLLEAALALETYDAVLAPAADGGVVAMGARRPWPDLSGLPWSSTELGETLVALCRSRQWRVAMLATLADVDCIADLLRAAPLLAADARPARQRLRRWLDDTRPALEASA